MYRVDSAPATPAITLLVAQIKDDKRLRMYPNEKAETKKQVKAKYVVEALSQGLRVRPLCDAMC